MAEQTGKRGRVLKLHGKTAIVDCDHVEYACRVPGRLKKGTQVSRSPVAVGDWVLFAEEDHSLEDGKELAGTITEVEERRTTLSRPSAHNTRLEQVIAANVDQLVIMVGANDIEVYLPLVDRLLVAAWMAGLQPIIVVNKIDLDPEGNASKALSAYTAFEVPMLSISAQESRGLEQVRKLLEGHTTVFAGPSGVGKSSTLNALDSSLELKTREVRESGAGRHTTTSVSLLPLPWGGYVVDTPGVREFGLWNIPRDELGLWYPDFENYRASCRYPSCSHTHEPSCKVREAVDAGEIDRGRYERYLQILQDLNDEERKRFS